MPQISPRVRVTICAIAAVSLTILAGCGTNKTADGNASLSGVQTSGSPSGAPAPSAGASATTTPVSSPSTAKSPAPITYPSTAQAYTADAVNAWANHDALRLAAYVNPGGAIEFANIERPSGPWHFHACSGDGDNTDCAFDNPVGDRVTVSMITAGLHQPHGVTDVVLDKTTFPNDASFMVNEFIGAWENGNTSRMTELSTGTTESKVNKLPQPSSTMMSIDTTTKPGHTIVTVDAADSATIVFDVDNAKLGHAHAIALVSIAQ